MRRCHTEFFCIVHLSFPWISSNNDISQRTFSLCHAPFRQCNSCGGEHILGPVLSSRQFSWKLLLKFKKIYEDPDFGISLRVCRSRQAGRQVESQYGVRAVTLWHRDTVTLGYCDTVWQRQAPYRTLLQWGGEGLASHTAQRVVGKRNLHHIIAQQQYKTQTNVHT